ncbi:MAG: FAD-dependent oxidoreductase [Victivallales bacterium]|nr:FAD-dependent oxidoreductase [Victivallales bacterium]
MGKKLEFNGSIPFDDTWDVIVVGGGPAGSAAATASSRSGAKTLLIEAMGCLGGMGTAGLVPSWCPFTDGEKFICGGIAKEVFLESKKGVDHISEKEIHGHIAINPEQLKRVYDNLVLNSGVEILFNTQVCSVRMDCKDRVSAIIVANKSGLVAYGGSVYIDCTGDGDVAAWAGASYEKGENGTGEFQPASLCFILSNVDAYHYNNGPNMHASDEDAPIWKILNSDRYSEVPDLALCPSVIGPNTLGFNAGHLVDYDNTDPKKQTQAFIKGRKIAKYLHEGLMEYHPKAFAASYLVSTAAALGVRESRRIMGEYMLTLEDYKRRQTFDDEIARNNYSIDMHHNKESSIKNVRQFREYLHDRDRKYAGSYGKGESYGIPYRSLIPQGIKNMLVAGRCISSDRAVQASTRVMPICLGTGEAAGVAAAFAVNNNNADVRDVDINRLRQQLRKNGAYLP